MVSEQDVERLITLEAPESVWREGDHYHFRKSTAGRIENMGPSQPYKHPVTNEVRNQHFKYANPTQSPFDMYLNIIPGMHPFQWDAASAVISASSFALGLADGAVDNGKNEMEFRKFREYLKEVDTKLLFSILEGLSRREQNND
jgi:hypothetical protein